MFLFGYVVADIAVCVVAGSVGVVGVVVVSGGYGGCVVGVYDVIAAVRDSCVVQYCGDSVVAVVVVVVVVGGVDGWVWCCCCCYCCCCC